MGDSQLGIALIYPTLLGTYGDGGNALVLAQRLRWRGYRSAVLPVDIREPLPRLADIYVLGGGEDAAQNLAVAHLAADGTLEQAASAGRPILAVCASYQILGRTYVDGAGVVHTGLDLLDCHTTRLPGPRAVGELVARPLLPAHAPLPLLTGFENHGGATTLGPGARPLATVCSGIGNGDGTEGAVQGSVIATYAHGPVLARNPALADILLRPVVGPLPALPDAEEDALREQRIGAVLQRTRPGRMRIRSGGG